MIMVRLDKGHAHPDATTYFQVSMEQLQKWYKFDFIITLKEKLFAVTIF